MEDGETKKKFKTCKYVELVWSYRNNEWRSNQMPERRKNEWMGRIGKTKKVITG